MAIKAGFYGASCYDLIQYVGHTLSVMGKGVLLMDVSNEQSLTCSIPLPEDYDGSEFEYRGITFCIDKPSYMEMDYDIVLVYLGKNMYTDFDFDYVFCVTTAELHAIDDAAQILDKLRTEYKDDLSRDEAKSKSLSGSIYGSKINIIALGACVSQRYKYIAMQLGISRRDLTFVDLDDVTYACRLASQYDSVVRFSNLSSDFKELIYRLCCTFSGREISKKEYRKYQRLAERGR